MSQTTANTRIDTSDQLWRALHLFNLYRLVIVGVITVVFFVATVDTVFGQKMPQIFGAAIIGWVSLVFISGFASRLRRPGFYWQVYSFILTDIAFIILLMYASGGITSGLGTLLLVTIAASGILLSGRMSFAFAALATLAIFSIQGYLILTGREPAISVYTQNGLLGAGLFAVALLSHILAQRVRTSEELAEQRKEELIDLSQANELIIQQMKTGIIVVDADNLIQLMNQSAHQMTGQRENLPGQPLKAISSELDQQLNNWRSTPFYEVRTFRIARDGVEILPHFKHLQGKSSLTTLIFLDDTSQLSHQAQQARLASLGRLTASIAHEIRNPLSAISHAGQLLNESESLHKSDHRLTEIIEQQTQRLNTIVENVLTLSRKKDFKPEKLNIVDWLKTFHTSMIDGQKLGPERIKVELPAQPVNIQVDATHLEQIMCNLCENGIRYSQLINADTLLKITCAETSDTGNVQIDICDYGTGVSEQHQQELFEPFFTTEPAGTGLGLFIARELSQLNHAHLQYIDEKAHGAHFRLTFSDQ